MLKCKKHTQETHFFTFLHFGGRQGVGTTLNLGIVQKTHIFGWRMSLQRSQVQILKWLSETWRMGKIRDLTTYLFKCGRVWEELEWIFWRKHWTRSLMRRISQTYDETEYWCPSTWIKKTSWNVETIAALNSCVTAWSYTIECTIIDWEYRMHLCDDQFGFVKGKSTTYMLFLR